MAAVCGVCGVTCDDDKSTVKCSACERSVHISCVKSEKIKTRAGNKEWKCDDCSKGKDSSASSTKSTSSDSALTKAFIINVLDSFKKEVFQELKLDSFKKEVCQELKSHTTTMGEFKTSLEFLSSSVDTSNVLMAEIRKEYEEIKKENAELRLKNGQLTETVVELRDRVRELEQYSRKTNIEISGIPVTGKEDIMTLVKDVGAAIGQELQDGQIMAAHRVPCYNKQRTPSIVVQFHTRLQRDTWITSFRQKKNLSASEVNKAFPNNRVYVNEHLTPENKRFLNQLKQMCKEVGVKYVWCRDGRFFVRKCEGERCYRISDLSDLKNVGK